MTDRDAFLARIHAHPDDDHARLVFADWLDEHDDPLGGILRAQHEYRHATGEDRRQKGETLLRVIAKHPQSYRQFVDSWEEWMDDRREHITEALDASLPDTPDRAEAIRRHFCVYFDFMDGRPHLCYQQSAPQGYEPAPDSPVLKEWPLCADTQHTVLPNYMGMSVNALLQAPHALALSHSGYTFNSAGNPNHSQADNDFIRRINNALGTDKVPPKSFCQLLSYMHDPNEYIDSGTLLHAATLYENPIGLLVLLAHGADPNKAAWLSGDTCLHLTTTHPFRLFREVSDLLLESGANPTLRNRNGETPEQVAHRNGYHVMADMLREAEQKWRAAHTERT